jgi:Zn-dependent peptidase ImmA (M78 family)
MLVTKNNPQHSAWQVLDQLGWSQPGDLTLYELASALGANVRFTTLKGSEGRILISGESAIITVSDNITNIGKQNFVLAHEIGHFVMHRDVQPLYSDTNQTLSEWLKNGPQEWEANAFAAELLMPSALFFQKVHKRKLSLALIQEIAEYFQVSITAAFLKYKDIGDYPLMVIFIEDGIVKWKQSSKDFPLQYLPLKSKVPAWTVAGEFFNGKGLEEKPELIDAIEWFPEDHRICYNKNLKLYEQCFQVSENGLISCLWTK